MKLLQHNLNAKAGGLTGLLIFLLVAFSVWAFSPHSPIIYSKSDNHPVGFIDFTSYYSAAKLAINGKPGEIYRLDSHKQELAKTIGTENIEALPYLYPPQTLIFFAPLAGLTIEKAFICWQVINILASLILLTLLRKDGIFQNKNGSYLKCALLIVSFYPWAVNMQGGQIAVVMTASLLGCHLLAKSNHPFAAGFLVVLTAFKPQIIMAPLLFLLIIHGKKLWIGTMTAGIMVAVICSLIFGLQIWQAYAELLAFVSAQIEGYGAKPQIMGSIRSLLLLITGKDNIIAINFVSTALWILSLGVAIWLSFCGRNKSNNVKELTFALIIAISSLASPWQHIFNFCILIISAAYLVKNHNFKKPATIYIGAAINFSLFTMFLDGIFPQYNPIFWVGVQILFILFISYKLIAEYKKSSFLGVVN